MQKAPAMTQSDKRMPVLFVGHGSPMNAIEENLFSLEWQRLGKSLPRPEAILCISAHWESDGSSVTAVKKPRTIHDFGGFPRELFEVEYPAPGSDWLVGEVRDTVKKFEIKLDETWGLDHGCWSVLKRMYPEADIPVVQLGMDYNKPAKSHYDLGKELTALRSKGVLIVGSGNIVHNLGMVSFRSDDFNEPFGFDWAIEANELFKKLIVEDRHDDLAGYESLGKSAQLAINSAEHYVPMLYVIALRQKGEAIEFFNDIPVAGSLTMTSFVIQ
jgi:4,5-DOPA dioxygenase extradiol